MNYHISIDGRIKKGVIFGLGNYAKTNIIPKIENKIKLLTIHEIDPTQIHKSYVKKYNVDTSEMLRDSEKYDAYFIAGYHHMHNQISLEAIMNNAYAVVEKPVVTSSQQLEELLTALKNNKGKLISCFQKKYSPLNKYIFQDFQRDTDDRPISYHCIIYEVKLPQFHWYTWPNSKSRLISNGCHWIDHFFYLNQYCDYLATDVCIAENGQLNCTIELKNGAFFTMALFDEGSHRIGMQEYIWLTAGDTTATILNSSKYCSENHKKVIRKVKVNKIEAYKTMYRCIAKTITDNGSGDEIHTIEVLWNAVFELETKYQEIIKNRAVGKNE